MNNKALEYLKGISILCVEDEDGIREFVVNTLKYYFDEVYEANCGNDAYKIYEEYKPDIILSDIQMKNGSGIELIKKIRKTDLDTTIFVLTAYSNEEYLIDLINLNIEHYILKPLNHKKLNEALQKYIDKNFVLEIQLCNGLFLDMQKRELIFEGDRILLRKKEKDFLELLYKNQNLIISYDQIENELWQDKEMTQHALKSFIKTLRSKLPCNIIKNIPQEGYTLGAQE